MTAAQLAAAKGRLDAAALQRSSPWLPVPPEMTEFREHAPEDLRLALAALERVRALAGRAVNGIPRDQILVALDGNEVDG